MYNSLIKCVFVISVIFLFSGCSQEKIQFEKEVKKYETENEIVYIEIPELKGFSDKNFQNEINSDLLELCTSLENSFLEEASKESENRIEKPELKVECEVKLNKNDLLSLEIQSYRYTEGSVGTYTRYIKNIDLRTNSEIKLESIFNDDEYIKLLNSKLENKSQDAIYSDLWETPKINKEQNEFFYFSDDGLVIFYPPYELSYYARGFVEFTIEYSELYGYLNPEYSFLYDI